MKRILPALAVAVLSSVVVAGEARDDMQYEVDAARPQLRIIHPAAPLTLDSIALKNTTTDEMIANTKLTIATDEKSGDAIVTVSGFENGTLPDGEYLIRAGDRRAEFFVLAGDVNRDRKVDSTDFNIISGNFGVVAANYSNGDLNYDGTVDSKDLNIFTAQNGKSLPAPTSQPTTRPG